MQNAPRGALSVCLREGPYFATTRTISRHLFE
jgi:hypothetical protein